MCLFFIPVSFSARLFSGSRPLERSLRLPDAPEPSGTPYTISCDSYPFSLGHPHPSRTRSISSPDALLVVVSWKNRLLVTRTVDRARVVVF